MPDESLTMRATVIAGQRYADDYAVIWRGMWIGRILRGAGAPHGTPPWSWSCHLPGRPQGNDDRGNAVDLDDAKQQFKAAWARIRAGLSEADIAGGSPDCRDQRRGAREIRPEVQSLSFSRVGTMQDRYAGDVGDYVKFALLRHLGPGRRWGIAWYLHPDTKDGGHTKYLREPERWRELDHKLFDLLSAIEQRQRSVAALQVASIITANFSNDRLDCSAVDIRERDIWRSKWFAEVLRKLSACDLVFADPDNGLVDDRQDRRRRAVFCKQIPLAEAKALAVGRTAVIYHHNTRRKGGHLAEIGHWMEQLGTGTIAVRANAYTCRTFFILNPDHEIRNRAISFCHRWKEHLVSFVG